MAIVAEKFRETDMEVEGARRRDLHSTGFRIKCSHLPHC